VDAYKALIEITKENPKAVSVTDPDTIRERQFGTEYLDGTPNSARSVAIKKRIIDGSRTYLEKRRVNYSFIHL
jgi:nuclear pore complex protein Nup93